MLKIIFLYFMFFLIFIFLYFTFFYNEYPKKKLLLLLNKNIPPTFNIMQGYEVTLV